MERHKPSTLTLDFCFFFFFFFSSFKSYSFSHSQPLPIVDNQEASDVEKLQRYIVHVQRPTYDELLGDEDHEEWHKSFLPNFTLDSGDPRLVYSYRYAISGFSARLTPSEVKAMESKEGFMHAKKTEKLYPKTTYTPRFLGLNRWDGLWIDSSMGAGVIIGIVDSGITPQHPSFQDDGTMPSPPPKWTGRCSFGNKTLCNNKLIGAMGFQGKRRPSPTDSKGDGHGTHVAGIAAGSLVDDAEVLGLAKGTASGTAPKAHLASYRVCFPRGGCDDDDILAAINQAIKDGVDVLSLSLGGTEKNFYNDNVAIGVFSAIRNRIFVSMAAGNEGPYKSTVPNTAPWILTVGASSHDRRIKATVRLGNGTELEGESGYQPGNLKAALPMVFPGFTGQNGSLGCLKNSFKNVDVKNKIVLCMIEQGKFRDMGVNVKKAGGAAMIVLDSFVEGSTTFSDDHVLPAAHINYTETRKLVQYFKTDPNPTATILFNGTKFGARPSPTIPYFSSRGPSLKNGGILKPDIVGPGVNILSAWPVKPGPNPNTSSTSNFNFLSGTSMATPHLAGIAALLKNTHTQWSPAMIKSAIMTTADRYDRDGKPIVDDYDAKFDPANLFAMGSGQVNPIAANDPGLVYELQPRDYIQYLCGLGYNDTQVSTIATRQIRCLNFGSITAEELNYPSISVSLDPSTKRTVRREVTNVGIANSVYSLKVEEPKGINVNVSPATLNFSQPDQKRRFNIEFSSKGMPLSKGEVVEGQLIWDSSKYLVRSPISVTII